LNLSSDQLYIGICKKREIWGFGGYEDGTGHGTASIFRMQMQVAPSSEMFVTYHVTKWQHGLEDIELN